MQPTRLREIQKGLVSDCSSRALLPVQEWIKIEENPQLCDENGATEEYLVLSKSASLCCYVCKENFSTEKTLTAHMRIHREIYASEELKTKVESQDGESLQLFVEPCDQFPSSDKLVEKKKVFFCYVCQEGFFTARDLRMHRRSHKDQTNRAKDTNLSREGVDPEDCATNQSSLKVPEYIKTDTIQKEKKNPFHCYICKASFFTKQGLKKHQKSHSGRKKRVKTPSVQTTKDPYLCHVCSRVFLRKDKLTKHLRIHTGEKPYKCDCGKGFAQREHLVAHKRIHSGEKPYACDVCGKAFNQRSPMTVHKRTHTGERPFSCIICEKAFITKYVLKLHVLTHTGEKPFPCTVCEKGFVSKKALELHMKTHKT